MPVGWPIPSLWAMSWMIGPCGLASLPTSKKYVSEETFSACTSPTAPYSACPALQNFSLDTTMHLPAPSASDGVITPDSRAARAVIGLNVEPVG